MIERVKGYCSYLSILVIWLHMICLEHSGTIMETSLRPYWESWLVYGSSSPNGRPIQLVMNYDFTQISHANSRSSCRDQNDHPPNGWFPYQRFQSLRMKFWPEPIYQTTPPPPHTPTPLHPPTSPAPQLQHHQGQISGVIRPWPNSSIPAEDSFWAWRKTCRKIRPGDLETAWRDDKSMAEFKWIYGDSMD